MTTLQPMRPAYGEALVELGWANEDVVVLSADVSNSDFSYRFAETFPERFINVGIAEQSLVDVAVGVASTGRVAIANTFAFLFATRALEMISHPLRLWWIAGQAHGCVRRALGLVRRTDPPRHHRHRRHARSAGHDHRGSG